MNRYLLYLAAFLAGIAIGTCAWAQATRPIGMNLNALRDYDPQAVYADGMRTARIDGGGGTLKAGATTWPTGDVRVWLARDIPRVSAGQWLIRVKGGAVQFAGNVKPLASSPPNGRYLTATIRVYSNGDIEPRAEPPPSTDAWYSFDVPAGTAHVYVDAKVSQPPAYLRAYRPGILSGPTALEPPLFNPRLLDLLRPFPGPLRGMDWLDTNSSPVVSFADQPGPDSITYNGGDDGRAAGSYRDFFELCNAANREPWINIPHKATTQFSRDVATLAKATVKPGLRCWLEFTNEHWNTGGPFQQSHYLFDEGKAIAATDAALRAGAENDWDIWHRHFARKTTQVGDAFASVYGRDRTVIVLGCHGEEPYWSEKMLTFLKAQGLLGSIDVIAIAPYMGDSDKTTTRPARTVDEVFNGREDIPGLLSPQQTSTGWNWRATQHQALAQKFGKRLVFYEFGVGINKLNAVTRAAQDDPRMGQVVERYLAPIPRDIVGCWFNLATEETNPWGLIIGNNVPNAKYDAAARAAGGQ